MFSWLFSPGYLAGNPLCLTHHQKRSQAARIERYLDDLWQEVKATIDNLPRETERQH